jgi:hypothetical protein
LAPVLSLSLHTALGFALSGHLCIPFLFSALQILTASRIILSFAFARGVFVWF